MGSCTSASEPPEKHHQANAEPPPQGDAPQPNQAAELAAPAPSPKHDEVDPARAVLKLAKVTASTNKRGAAKRVVKAVVATGGLLLRSLIRTLPFGEDVLDLIAKKHEYDAIRGEMDALSHLLDGLSARLAGVSVDALQPSVVRDLAHLAVVLADSTHQLQVVQATTTPEQYLRTTEFSEIIANARKEASDVALCMTLGIGLTNAESVASIKIQTGVVEPCSTVDELLLVLHAMRQGIRDDMAHATLPGFDDAMVPRYALDKESKFADVQVIKADDAAWLLVNSQAGETPDVVQQVEQGTVFARASVTSVLSQQPARHALFLATSGYGKSSAVKFLTLQQARAVFDAATQVEKNAKPWCLTELVPVVVEAKALVAALGPQLQRLDETTLGVDKLFEAVERSTAFSSSPELRTAIKTVLVSGCPVQLFVDALDEVTSLKARKNLLAWLHGLARKLAAYDERSDSDDEDGPPEIEGVWSPRSNQVLVRRLIVSSRPRVLTSRRQIPSDLESLFDVFYMDQLSRAAADRFVRQVYAHAAHTTQVPVELVLVATNGSLFERLKLTPLLLVLAAAFFMGERRDYGEEPERVPDGLERTVTENDLYAHVQRSSMKRSAEKHARDGVAEMREWWQHGAWVLSVAALLDHLGFGVAAGFGELVENRKVCDAINSFVPGAAAMPPRQLVLKLAEQSGNLFTASEEKGAGGDVELEVRFAHLSVREYLVAMLLASDLPVSVLVRRRVFSLLVDTDQAPTLLRRRSFLQARPDGADGDEEESETESAGAGAALLHDRIPLDEQGAAVLSSNDVLNDPRWSNVVHFLGVERGPQWVAERALGSGELPVALMDKQAYVAEGYGWVGADKVANVRVCQEVAPLVPKLQLIESAFVNGAVLLEKGEGSPWQVRHSPGQLWMLEQLQRVCTADGAALSPLAPSRDLRTVVCCRWGVILERGTAETWDSWAWQAGRWIAKYGSKWKEGRADEDGRLAVCAMGASVGFLQRLQRHGQAEWSTFSYNGRDATSWAAAGKNMEAVKFFLSSCEIRRDDPGRTPLVGAAEGGDLRVFQHVLEDAGLEWTDEEREAAFRAGITHSPILTCCLRRGWMDLFTELDLDRCGLSDDDVRVVAEALQVNSTLTVLLLHGNQISDVAPLAEALRVNSTLTMLNVLNNQISDVAPLGEALRDNLMLTTLVLDSNQISDVAPLGEALKVNQTLTRLSLDSNQISDVAPLAEALQVNSTLTDLQLGGNPIADVARLAEALRVNQTLTSLYLHSTSANAPRSEPRGRARVSSPSCGALCSVTVASLSVTPLRSALERDPCSTQHRTLA